MFYLNYYYNLQLHTIITNRHVQIHSRHALLFLLVILVILGVFAFQTGMLLLSPVIDQVSKKNGWSGSEDLASESYDHVWNSFTEDTSESFLLIGGQAVCDDASYFNSKITEMHPHLAVFLLPSFPQEMCLLLFKAKGVTFTSPCTLR